MTSAEVLALIATAGDSEGEPYLVINPSELSLVTVKPVQLWPLRGEGKPRNRDARWIGPGWVEVEGPIVHAQGVALEARLGPGGEITVYAVRCSGHSARAFGKLWIKILERR